MSIYLYIYIQFFKMYMFVNINNILKIYIYFVIKKEKNHLNNNMATLDILVSIFKPTHNFFFSLSHH